MRKSECMIQYHLARMPMYGAYESAQYAKANELRENMKNLGAPTGLPPQHRQCGTPCALIAALWCCRDEGQGTLGARARVTKRPPSRRASFFAAPNSSSSRAAVPISSLSCGRRRIVMGMNSLVESQAPFLGFFL